MSRMNIRGSEYPIKKIFSDDFVFTIPLYQRPYSWTTEQSEEMLQDLLRAMEGPEEAIDELAPYFLGSIVLIKGDEADSQVIDGQQRLTTLTMLLSALRSLIKSDYAKDLTALSSAEFRHIDVSIAIANYSTRSFKRRISLPLILPCNSQLLNETRH